MVVFGSRSFPILLLLHAKKGSAVSHITIKFVRSQNLFLPEKKRIREGNLTCPHKPGGQNLFCFSQKRIRSWEDQFSGGFIHHFEPIRALEILFYLGEKGFSV